MRISVNGAPRDFDGTTVAQLLEHLNIDLRRVAVEVNLSIVRKADYAVHALGEGDTVEIVNFVGGG
jgi:thiamine biosynthesis protein ThiS